MINNLQDKNSKGNAIPDNVKVKHDIVTDKLETANAINAYFTNVGPNIALADNAINR